MRGFYGVERHPVSQVFRVRVSIPTDLRPIIGRRSITKTLSTKDPEVAKRRAAGTRAPIDQLIEQARARLGAGRDGLPAAPMAMPRDFVVRAIAEWAAEAEAAVVAAIWQGGPDASLTHVFPDLGVSRPRDFNIKMTVRLTSLIDVAAPREMSFGEGEQQLLRRIMHARGVLVPMEPSASTTAALGLLRAALLKIGRTASGLASNDWAPVLVPEAASAILPPAIHPGAPPRPAGEPRSLSATAKPPTVLELVEDHIKRTKPKATGVYAFRLAARRLLAFMQVQDTDARQVTHAIADEFAEFLRKLPASMRPADWKRGVHALVSDYEQGLDARKRIGGSTVIKDLNLLHAVWSRPAKRKHVPDQVFGGLLSKREARPQIVRLPFTADQVSAIFHAPLFTGCADPENWRDAGSHLVDDERFWLPVLACTMGVRLEEAGQLHVADVKTAAGVSYLHITEVRDDEDAQEDAAADDNAKTVKTAPSRRRVPLPPSVLALGFLDYVARQRRAGEERLFPRLRRNANDKLTARISQWFNRDVLATVGITSRSRRLHSFRHLFIDSARDTDIREDVRKALCGHSSKGVHEQYGSGFNIKVLDEAMRRIEIPGFPLARLIEARRAPGAHPRTGSPVGAASTTPKLPRQT